MKRILFFITSAFLLLSAAGCINDPVGPDVPKEPETRTYSFKVSLPFDGEAGTRSLINVNTSEPLYSLAMYAFADGVLKEGPMVLSDLGGVMDHDFEWNMPGLDGKTVTFYALGNYDGNFSLPTVTKNVTTTSEMQSLTYEIDKNTFLAFESKGILAASTFTIENFDNSKEIDFDLKRLFAKYEVKVSVAPDVAVAGYAKRSIKYNGARCNKRLTPFAPSRATSESDMIELDKLLDPDLATVDAGGYAVIYLPENVQGTATSVKHWSKVEDENDLTLMNRLDYNVDYFIAYDGESFEKHVTTYHIYPGTVMNNSDDKQEDFNVVRNVHKKLNLTLLNDEKATIAVKLKVPAEGLHLPPNGEVEVEYGVKGISDPSERRNLYVGFSCLNNAENEATGYPGYVYVYYNSQRPLTDTPITINGVEYPYSGSIIVRTYNANIGTVGELKFGEWYRTNENRAIDAEFAVVVPEDVTWEGENRWYLPGTSSDSYMEILSSSSYPIIVSEFSNMEVCLATQSQASSEHYGTGKGFVPCEFEFVPDGSGKYFIKVKVKYSDIVAYHSNISSYDSLHGFGGIRMALLARKPDVNGEMIYFNLGSPKIYLGIPIVSYLEKSAAGTMTFNRVTNITANWPPEEVDNNYYLIPALRDEVLSFTTFSSGSVDASTMYIPVTASISNERRTILGSYFELNARLSGPQPFSSSIPHYDGWMGGSSHYATDLSIFLWNDDKLFNTAWYYNDGEENMEITDKSLWYDGNTTLYPGSIFPYKGVWTLNFPTTASYCSGTGTDTQGHYWMAIDRYNGYEQYTRIYDWTDDYLSNVTADIYDNNYEWRVH